jgi:hypothetical protein
LCNEESRDPFYRVAVDFPVLNQGGTMAIKAKTGWQILLVAVWINFSGTVRWMLFAKQRFDALYEGRGLEFPNALVNNILWIVWGVLAAVLVVFLSKKSTMLLTFALSWLAAFAMHWIVLWNAAALPLDLLWIAVPWSLVEVFIAALISIKLQGQGSAGKG